jgi:hypothetical protein
VKADFGSEFKDDLDKFLGHYNIELTISKPYSKGSSLNAESAIKLVKGALRQLCLTHTHNWPELVPILVQGLNTQGLYGTSTTRSQLYFSPYSFPNSVKLNNLLFPESIENFEKLNFIIKRRQYRLTKKNILDKTRYQPGNIVFAVNHPIKSDGNSQELAMTVRGIYYVKDVHPALLRLIGIFAGEERNLPHEYCLKISLDNLSKLQFQLQSLQLQKVADNLFRANKYLGPDASKTWNFLLNKITPCITMMSNTQTTLTKIMWCLGQRAMQNPPPMARILLLALRPLPDQTTFIRSHHQTIPPFKETFMEIQTATLHNRVGFCGLVERTLP